MPDMPEPRALAASLAELERKLEAAAAEDGALPPEATAMLAQLRTLNAALADLADSLTEQPPRPRDAEPPRDDPAP